MVPSPIQGLMTYKDDIRSGPIPESQLTFGVSTSTNAQSFSNSPWKLLCKSNCHLLPLSVGGWSIKRSGGVLE